MTTREDLTKLLEDAMDIENNEHFKIHRESFIYPEMGLYLLSFEDRNDEPFYRAISFSAPNSEGKKPLQGYSLSLKGAVNCLLETGAKPKKIRKKITALKQKYPL